MRILSIFDGIGGCRQALKELNIDCEYYSSEIDKFAIKVAMANHSDIVQVGDVKDIWFDYSDDGYPTEYVIEGEMVLNYRVDNRGRDCYLGSVDLLVGGFPCQSFSIAGKRKGFEDERGNLFFEALRILKEVKPKYFLFENVNSMSKENRDIISEKLGVEPIMINSALLTAQQRKRLYWTNIPNVNQPEDKGIVLKDIIENGYTDRLKSYAITATYGNSCTKDYFLKYQRQLIFTKPVRIGQFGKGGIGERIYSIDGKSICLSALSGGIGAKTGLYEIKPYIRKLTPVEACRLQGFPDSYVSSVSKNQAYKALGNSFTVPVIKHILSKLLQNEHKSKKI